MRHRARLEHRTRTVTRCCRMFSSPVGPKSLLSPARKPRAEGPWAGALYTLVSFQGFQRMRIKAHLFYRGLLLCARCGKICGKLREINHTNFTGLWQNMFLFIRDDK